MTPDELRAIGEALYGSRWQRDLARSIDRNVRTIQRMAKGEMPIYSGVAESVRDLVRERLLVLFDLM